MVRETQSDVKPNQEHFLSAIISDATAPKRKGRLPKRENGEIQETHHLLDMEPLQRHNHSHSSMHHSHQYPHLLNSTTGPSVSLHQHQVVMVVDDDAEKEASNDEFEHLVSEPTQPRKKTPRPVKSAAMSTTSPTNPETRRAKRASGEHLWKHRCFWDEEETE